MNVNVFSQSHSDCRESRVHWNKLRDSEQRWRKRAKQITLLTLDCSNVLLALMKLISKVTLAAHIICSLQIL